MTLILSEVVCESYERLFEWGGLWELWTFIWQVKELNASLETEKASRTDLEMYVAVLNTQKNVLTEDADKLRLQLQEGTANICYWWILVVCEKPVITGSVVFVLRLRSV